MNVSTRLKQARTARRLSMRELARRSGVSVTQICHLESTFRNAGIATVEALALALGVSPAWLAGWTDQQETTDCGPVLAQIQAWCREAKRREDFCSVGVLTVLEERLREWAAGPRTEESACACLSVECSANGGER